MASPVLLVAALAQRASALGASFLPATVTGSVCRGSTDILSWPAADVAGLTGYRIIETNEFFPDMKTFDVPATQTSLLFPVQFEPHAFLVYTVTSNGISPEAFATGYLVGVQAPQPVYPDNSAAFPLVAGDGFATVSFRYFGPTDFFQTGMGNVTVTVTATPGEATIASPLTGPIGSEGVVDTFTGLTNGVTYTFVAVASNQCGSSPPSIPLQVMPTAATTTTTTTTPPTTTTTPPTTTTIPPTTTTTSTPGAFTCFVSGVRLPPDVARAQQIVTVQAADGLNSISNIRIVNGVVNVDTYQPGTASPVIVTATKANPSQRTVWSFDMTDVKGRTKHCG